VDAGVDIGTTVVDDGAAVLAGIDDGIIMEARIGLLMM